MPKQRDWSGSIVRYPDPAIEIIDEARFGSFKLGNAVVDRLWTGARWTEGPVYFGDGGFLLFSDIPNNRILRYDEETDLVTLFRKPSNNSNGQTRDRQGRLISCEHFTRRVTRTEYDGTLTVLIDQFESRPLNAPNDVVVHSDDSIWFTDPGYGILFAYEGQHAEFELPTRVYRIDGKSQVTTVVAEDMDMPNGLCFSPDEKILYVSDTGEPKNIRAYEVNGQTLSKGRCFVEMTPGLADGIRCDIHGNLWASAAWVGEGYDGVHCFAPDGKIIGKIHLPEGVSNLCFGGGTKKNRLYITGSQSLYAVYLETKGAHYP
jgi:gluconolactonase